MSLLQHVFKLTSLLLPWVPEGFSWHEFVTNETGRSRPEADQRAAKPRENLWENRL